MKSGYTNLPIKKWKAEQSELNNKQNMLNIEYKKLKEETHNVEQIKRSVEQILRENTPEQKVQNHDIEL